MSRLSPLSEDPFDEEGTKKLSKKSHAWKSWVKNLFSHKKSDLKVLLSVLACPLFPVSLQLNHAILQVSSSSQYIIEHFKAATGCKKLEKMVVKNIFATGKVSMTMLEEPGSNGSPAVVAAARATHKGCFVMWEMVPNKWSIELVVDGHKVLAGSDGNVAWRYTPWLGSHPAKGGVRPLRRTLQVSYKWLSRNYLVSSNAAKKLLQEFVDKHKDNLEVVYTVAGWLRKAPATYHISLVPGPKLSEAKHDFEGSCSIQVYSVQACIPKDPAAIWNAEFIQAEQLFKEPISVDNCLRDNRFCGVLNSVVKRNVEGEPVANNLVTQAKSAGPPGQVVGSSVAQLQVQPIKSEQASPISTLQSSSVTTSKTKTDRSVTFDQKNKESDRDNNSLPTKKNVQNDKSSAGTGSSLANLWGRASSKPKSTTSAAEERFATSKTNGVSDSADAQISACENLETASSDDETDVKFKRAFNDGGKKRRVVLDDSDEEDEEIAVNLGLFDVSNGKSSKNSRQSSSDIEKTVTKFEDQEECKPIVMEEKLRDVADHYAKEEFAALCTGKNVRTATSEGINRQTPDVDTSSKSKAADAAPISPKRRKVLKTRIDERGREVTEVVWEGEEVDAKDTNLKKHIGDGVKIANGNAEKFEEKGPANPVNRPATTKKSPAVGSSVPSLPAGKAGNKKGSNLKDPKQGNILSFFKKV